MNDIEVRANNSIDTAIEELSEKEKSVLFSETNIIDLTDEDISILHSASFKVINQSIQKRKINDRDSLTQALRAGRILKEILKPTVKHGEWERYILNRTNYNNVRQAQIDMQIWSAWKPFAEQLVSNGIIFTNYLLEQELVSNLDEDAVHVSVSAMAQFAYKDVPQIALEIALKRMENNGGFSIAGARKIIEVAKVIETLPDNKSKEIAHKLVETHNVDNPDIIKEIPKLTQENPQIIDEMMETGTIFVPGVGGEGEHIPIDRASKTDIEIAAKRHGIEAELENQYKNRDILPTLTKEQFAYINTYTGTLAQLAQIMLNLNNADTQGIYKISLQKKK